MLKTVDRRLAVFPLRVLYPCQHSAIAKPMGVKNPRRLSGAEAAIEGVFSTVREFCAWHEASVKRIMQLSGHRLPDLIPIAFRTLRSGTLTSTRGSIGPKGENPAPMG